MEQQKLNILSANILKQQHHVEAIYSHIAARKKGYTKDRVVLESLAYQLHNLYCAFEDLFRIVANYFENHLTEEIAWHKELLNRMTLEIKGESHATATFSSLLRRLSSTRPPARQPVPQELGTRQAGA